VAPLGASDQVGVVELLLLHGRRCLARKAMRYHATGRAIWDVVRQRIHIDQGVDFTGHRTFVAIPDQPLQTHNRSGPVLPRTASGQP
jgi:hypothetical protein